MTLNIDRLLLFLLPYIGFRTSVSTLQRFHLPLCPKFHTEAVSLFCTLYSSYSCMCYFHPALLLPFWLKGNPLKSGNFRYSYVIIGISPNYVACALLFFCLTWYSPPQIWWFIMSLLGQVTNMLQGVHSNFCTNVELWWYIKWVLCNKTNFRTWSLPFQLVEWQIIQHS